MVLGNRQLVSVFLIVVVLLGVFFSMGYIVGRNSSPATRPGSRGAPTPSQPIVVDNPARTLPLVSDAANQTPVRSGHIRRKPSPRKSKPPEAKPATPSQRLPKPKKPKPPEPKHEPKAEPVPTKPSIEGPQPGQTFLQVVATTRADAELIAETLGKKGFHTAVAPGPNGLFRVLVGPLQDAADMAETRVRLEATGFKNPLLRKY